MKCPRCQHENRPQAKFCEECGIPCQGASPTAVSNAEPKSEVENLRRALSEALEQQMATGEILRVIASSPSDVRPVFDTILDNATRLCEAHRGGLFLFDGEAYHAAAFRGAASALVEHHSRAPIRPGPHTALARVLRELRPVHIDDVVADAAFAEGDPLRRAVVELEGMRTLLMVPLLKEGRLVGALAVHRREVRPFTDRQMDLLQTFAAQAVIAIENVRLSNETKEALEQQTATAEILRVIASSPTELQPVMDVVAGSAARFCGAPDTSIWRLEGELLRRAATQGRLPASTSIGGTIAVSPRDVAGRAVLDRQTIHIEDLLGPSETTFPETQERLRRLHVPTRTMLATPLLREDAPIGVIVMRRGEVQPFTDKQIELARTFAAQAVIAIENVRLFTELEARNRDLTATSDILQVISRSPTDAQPVFETIIRSAVGLCEAARGNVYRFDGRLIHHVAQHGMKPAGVTFPGRRAVEASRAGRS
jgi:two-component system, NtrC family, sensor kinase